jgi:osmoprotectant transport system substrate-binding protein
VVPNKKSRRAAAVIAAGAAVAVGLVGCSSGSPLGTSENGGSATSDALIVGSASFAENEIIAQIYAQALAAKNIAVTTRLNIGQRDVYLAALKDGSIDVIPEYSGNLLQFYNASSTAKSSGDVMGALKTALPPGTEVLDPAAAEDKDSYNVTAEFSIEHGVTSLADLPTLAMPLAVGANPELAERPYGIPGLMATYGASKLVLTPISDSGGPLTVKALRDDAVQLADIYTTSPAIQDNGFVTLTDPKSLIIAQNVVPLINSSKASSAVKAVLNAVSAALTTVDLVALNRKNQGSEKSEPEALARDWLAQKNLL